MSLIPRFAPGWRLPIAPCPKSGESWRSVLSRTAQLNNTTVTTLCTAAQIPDEDILSSTHVARISTLLGLSETAIQSLTLGQWTGVAYRTDPQPHRSRQGPSWTWISDRYRCPECLNQGVSLLEWRLPWITTCARHKRFLEAGPVQRSPTPAPDDLRLTTLFSLALRSESSTQFYDTWRDSLRLAVAMRRESRPCRYDAPAPIRSRTLLAVASLAMASSPEERASTLSRWCIAAGVARPWGDLHRTLSSPAMRDASDCISASWWSQRQRVSV